MVVEYGIARIAGITGITGISQLFFRNKIIKGVKGNIGGGSMSKNAICKCSSAFASEREEGRMRVAAPSSMHNA